MMKILVGYDGSSDSKSALNLAVTHAKAFTGKIFAVTSMVKGTEAEQDAIKHLETELALVKNDVESQGIPCETHLLIRGMTPGEDIVTFAQENDMDEIVIGIRRLSKVGKLVFGSNGQYIILNAHCPVTTVK
jgi:nucleotide-binding universal stress UspA family protein